MRHPPFVLCAACAVTRSFARSVLALVGFALLLAGAGLGCGNDFESRAHLSKLRLLALQTDPVNPAEGESTTITPLVYAPSTEALSFSWSWCPLLGKSDEGYTCAISYAEAEALASAAGVTSPLPSFDLGSAATASFKNVFPATVLAGLCEAGVQGQKVDCKQGFPVRVTVRVVQGDALTGATQTGTTVLRLPTVPGAVSNANPVLDGMSVELAAGVVPLDATGSVQVPRARDSKLHVTVDEAEAETYVGPDADGKVTTQKETLLFSWFAELGDLHDERTLFIDGANTLADEASDKWKPPATREEARGLSRLIVVVRDDRGGVNWTTAAASLEATP